MATWPLEQRSAQRAVYSRNELYKLVDNIIGRSQTELLLQIGPIISMPTVEFCNTYTYNF